MSPLLVVSPHLDDAVLSCGAGMRACGLEGGRVIVATVFTEGEGHGRRRDEDAAALRGLGVEAIHLGLEDAPERLGIERTHDALVRHAVVAPEDLRIVTEALSGAIERVQPARVWAPLGVGGHIDHRVVFEALRARPGVSFYEERPYAFLPGAVRARLHALGARVRDASPDLAAPPDRQAVRQALAALPHLCAYLPIGAARGAAQAWLEEEIFTPPRETALWLSAEVTAYGPEAADAVARASRAYGSQVGDLFGGEEGVAPLLEAASRGLAGARHAERRFSPV